MFKGEFLKVERAIDPSLILWQNYGYSSRNRCFRRILSLFIAILECVSVKHGNCGSIRINRSFSSDAKISQTSGCITNARYCQSWSQQLQSGQLKPFINLEGMTLLGEGGGIFSPPPVTWYFAASSVIAPFLPKWFFIQTTPLVFYWEPMLVY